MKIKRERESYLRTGVVPDGDVLDEGHVARALRQTPEGAGVA